MNNVKDRQVLVHRHRHRHRHRHPSFSSSISSSPEQWTPYQPLRMRHLFQWQLPDQRTVSCCPVETKIEKDIIFINIS